MSLLLYINGQLADLEAGQAIAQTKQVNDLNSLDNRQTNYTNKFKLPKTAANIRIMDFLTLPGNTSEAPYRHNECSLYSESGECFVYKGRAVITDGGDHYEAVIYDGIVSLYKAIENASMAELELKDLEHRKSVAAVVDSWNPALNKPYRYILADYNGNTGNTNSILFPTINVDYLVPSVNVAWLWAAIFAKYGFSYSGSVFLTQQFKNLWLTYPKGIDTTDEGLDIFASSDFNYVNRPVIDDGDVYWRTLLLKFPEPSTNDLQYLNFDVNQYRLKVREAGYYKVTLTGNINSRDAMHIFLGKDITYTTSGALNSVTPYKTFAYAQVPDEDFTHSRAMYLEANESLSLMMRHHEGTTHAIRFDGDAWESLEITMQKLTLSDVSFADAFAELPIRDFLNEIVHRFGLTLYKDRYENHYEFLTLQEVLQSGGEMDYSDKLVKKGPENYIYGNYAQRNWFRYNYNDKESTHNDGYLDVENVNLAESRDTIKSKFYSPERYKSRYLGRGSNVYKLWDKEVVEEPGPGEEPVNYKPLDKRFYLLRAEPITKALTLLSPATGESMVAFNCWIENYWKLPFAETLQDYYQPLQQLIDRSAIVTADLYLKDTDVAGFDFRKLYYLKQYGAYFLMNKINNYVSGKPAKCELIRVQTAMDEKVLPPAVKITKVEVLQELVRVYFELTIPLDDVVFEYEVGNNSWGQITIPTTSTPWLYHLSPPGQRYVRIKAGNEYSNIVPVVIPSNQTIIIP